MSTAADEKLIIRFFNVGDGDSALLKTAGEKPYRLLVDAGSSVPEALEGGRSCAEHLRALGVDRLADIIITVVYGCNIVNVAKEVQEKATKIVDTIVDALEDSMRDED